MRIVVSVHDPPVWTLPAREVTRLQASLPEDEVVDARTPEERRAAFPEAEVLVAFRIGADEFASARRLRWIHTTAVGVNGLLPRPVVESPVLVTNTRGVHAAAIAEHAVALMLAVRRRFPQAAVGQAGRRWLQAELMQAEGPPLSASCLLVVGLGEIGSRVAALGAGLGMRVIAVRRRADAPMPPGVSAVAGPERLHEFLGQADVVVLAVPQTDETRALLGPDEFDVMRQHAVLVNVARGGLVDDAALEQAIRTGRLGGAGLDAFAREPLPPDSPLWRLPNVVITPHSAAFAGDYWAPAVDFFLRNLERFRRGEPLMNLVDKVHRY